jgi:hypothetical protein
LTKRLGAPGIAGQLIGKAGHSGQFFAGVFTVDSVSAAPLRQIPLDAATGGSLRA